MAPSGDQRAERTGPACRRPSWSESDANASEPHPAYCSDSRMRRPSWSESDANANASEPHINHPAYCTDAFRMFDFKVRPCPRTRAHDWTQCPFAHPGEKARRRDPRKYPYSAVPCPSHRKGTCKRGDACEYAHGVFECWLHPTRYRTQMCTDGPACQRLVCFFAHHESELRAPSEAGTCPRVIPAPAQPQRAGPLPASGEGPHPGNPLDHVPPNQLFSLAHLLALQLALQNQQQQQGHGQLQHPSENRDQTQHQRHQGDLAAAFARQAGGAAFGGSAMAGLGGSAAPYYPIKHGLGARHHPLSPSSPLEGNNDGILFVPPPHSLAQHQGLGSMDNILSSLPRSLSDVSLSSLK